MRCFGYSRMGLVLQLSTMLINEIVIWSMHIAFKQMIRLQMIDLIHTSRTVLILFQ